METRVSLRGRKPALSQTDIHNIDRLIQEQSDITIHEIREKLQLQVSDETVRKAVLKLGYVYKKKSLHASEQERLRCQGQKGSMEKHIPENDVNNLVFLDESGVNTNMTGHYVRSKRNERAVDRAPVNTPCSTTILSSHMAGRKDGPYGLSGRHYSGTVCGISGKHFTADIVRKWHHYYG